MHNSENFLDVFNIIANNWNALQILLLNLRDDALQQLLPGDVVVNMDEETLAEKLLYLTSFKLMYETTTFNVISITTT